MSLVAAAGISAAASLAGGFLSSRSNASQNQANLESQALDRKYQKEFAQKGIGWRVADAKAAGIHPLYAMGASIPAYSPSAQNVGGDENPFQGLAQAGQDVGNAVARGATKVTREQVTMARLQIVNQSLQNDALRLANNKAVNGTPAFPNALQPFGDAAALDGQGLPAGVEVQSSKTPASLQGDPSKEAAPIPESRWMRTEAGFMKVPSEPAKEAMEENMLLTALYNWRNYIKPIVVPGSRGQPPPMKPPKGAKWFYDPLGFGWVLDKIGSRTKMNRRMKGVMKYTAKKRKSRYQKYLKRR